MYRKIIMCGIYASFSSSAGKKVLEGLKRIEYRGYDSWGVATLDKGKIKIKKEVGKLSDLRNVKFPEVRLSLGHTRWATHGGVTKANAHPHLASDGSFALVQNGVVENYQELKSELLKDGYNFVSETDTEVIMALFEKEMEKENVLTPKLFATVFKKLAGRNTIAVITTDGQIMAIRNGSPLVIGRNFTDDLYFSSDVLSISLDADRYTIVNSGEMVIFDSKNGDLSITDIESNKRVKVKFKLIENRDELVGTLKSIGKNGFDSFMLKEIHEQSHILSNVLKSSGEKFAKAIKILKKAEQVFTLGSGSASFASGNTAYLLRKNGIFTSSIQAYEADSYKDLFNNKTACIVFSQSGETADTNEVVELMKEKGVTIFDILSGEKFSDIEIKFSKFEDKLKEWFSNKMIQNKIRTITKDLVKNNHLFVLGRGDLYYAGLESALKLKEISYIHAEGFSGGELKHGVIALITKNTPVLCLVAEDENKANMLSSIAEVRARGGRIIAVARDNNELYNDWIQLPDTDDYIFLSSVIPSQLITCYMAMEKGYDVDKPRNLAKSVTVK